MGSALLWLVVPGLVTGLGGLALAVVRHPGPRLLDTPLGATAGIILAAVVFSLLVPPLEDGSVWEVVAGFAVAAAVLAALAATIPHVHERIVERTLRREEHRAALMLGALTIHDLPEGLAAGVAFGAGDRRKNIPEGFAAAALVHALRAARGAPAALLGYTVAETTTVVLPVDLAFAAGAMVYVVVDEIIPESHGRGHERGATAGVVAGFALMMLLDTALS